MTCCLTPPEPDSGLKHLKCISLYKVRRLPGGESGNDRVIYPVEIDYEIPIGGRAVFFDTIFTAHVGSGLNDGMVELEETGRIRDGDYHLSFSPAWRNSRQSTARRANS